MDNLTWHQIDSDGTVRFRSAGHVSASVLRALYENGTGFDVELFGTAAAGEDPDTLQPIRAHKMILMHASKHLHELFTVDGYLDSHQTQHKFTEISHESLNDIVKFIYNDELNFCADCASHRMQNVLTGAKFLVMPDLAFACETYLAGDKHLALENCMSMLRFARKYVCLLLLTALLNLTAKTLPYFTDNLGFLNLNKEEVTKLLLSEPVITLADADQRCRAAVAWLNHDRPARDACISDILSLVPFDLDSISLGTLAAVGNNATIRTQCAEKFMNTMFDGVAETYRQRDDHRSGSTRAVLDVLRNAGSGRDIWFLIGGHDANTEFVMYDVRRRYWSKLPDLPWTRTEAGACVMGNKTVFVFGGRKNNKLSADIDQYDLTAHEWTTSSMQLGAARMSASVCCATLMRQTFSSSSSSEQSAFIFGGYPKSAYKSVEKFCASHVDGKVSFGRLEVMPKMCVGRYRASVVRVGNGSFFLAGGNREDLDESRLSSIEKYDCVTNKWSAVASMRSARSSHMSAVLGDDWYLAGGYDGRSSCDVVEILNTRTGQIRPAPSLLSARSCGSGVALDRNTFCVVGGEDDDDRGLRSVECLDVREGKWSTGSIVPDMPTANSDFSFAAYDDSNL